MQIYIKHAINTLLGEEKELIYLGDLYLIFKVSANYRTINVNFITEI